MLHLAEQHLTADVQSPVPFAPHCSDEIYALSVYKQQATFTSAITLAQQLVGQAGSGNGAPAAADGGGDGSVAADGVATGGGYSQELVDTYVHLVYGLSKDWCASGLRVGLLYSRNARLQTVRGRRGSGWCA